MRRDFSENLIKWLKNNPRNLIWKKDKDAYSTWLSEIIMQQTRVEYGSKYYVKFKQLFPTVFDLANADQQEVLKAWEGLGYYSRARNLHITAKYVAHNFNGVFPSTFKELLQLKGVGSYTAAAILSFVYNQPKAAIDGNAYRVLARHFGISTAIDSTLGKKEFQQLGDELIQNTKHPAEFNQAMMNLGATVCKPKQPQCNICPIEENCIAQKLNQQTSYPVKSKKIKRKKRYFYFYVLFQGDKVYIEERLGNDIWKNLFQFPLVESEKEVDWVNTLDKSCLAHIQEQEYQIRKIHKEGKQILSHQEIFATFVEIKLKTPIQEMNYKEILQKDLKNYPFPLVINNYLKKRLT